MKSRVLSSLIVLAGLSLVLGSCLNDEGITPYQRFQKEVATIDAYLATHPPKPSEELIRDAASGIRMVIIEQPQYEPGEISIPPTPENIIQVSYTGWLLPEVDNGDPFETRDLYTFTLTNADAKGEDVIPGWKTALYMMTEGTKARVFIPSALAYGTRGTDAIPGNAILVFDLELKTVNTDDQEPQFTTDIDAISTYIEQNAITNVQIHDSGLRYTVQNEGTGASPGLYDQVLIRYTGKVMGQQTPFANNATQGPTEIFSSRVVDYVHGLTIELNLMKEGGKATFFIPSTLGYGLSARTDIPKNSNLIFEIELLKVTKNQQ